MISFTNPGTIDPRLITTLGVNVKSDSQPNPIGFFGTGLKYAIAVLCREGEPPTIWSDLDKYEFTVREDTVRGKSFGFIHMRRTSYADDPVVKSRLATQGPWQPMGFTTEFGKQWTLDHAYRELHCNCLDEGGTGGQEGEPQAKPGMTTVCVSGPKFADTHERRYEFLLNPKRLKLHATPEIEVYMGTSKQVFYRGIAVRDLGVAHSTMTYNILSPLRLSEDRQVYSWESNQHIAKYMNSDAPEAVLSSAFTTRAGTLESTLDFQWCDNPSKVFCTTIERLSRSMPGKVPDNVTSHWIRKGAHKSAQKFQDFDLLPVHAQALKKAMEFLANLGYYVGNYPVRVSHDLGDGIAGRAIEGTIWLSARVLTDPDFLASTLLEEFIHLDRKVFDETRAMQNVLFSEIIRLGRRIEARNATR